MKTGSHLKIRELGSNTLGVKLEGNPKKPEPDSFRVHFPGGCVDIERCSDGDYWVHVIVNNEDRLREMTGDETDEIPAQFLEARLHMMGKHSSEANLGDFENPGLYDVALKVGRL